MSTDVSPPLNQSDLRKLLVLIAASAVDMIGFAIVLPLLPFYAENLNASYATIGWIIASFSIAQLIAAPLWGRVSDRYGRRPALLIGLSASAVAYVVFGLASTVTWLFLSRIIQGAGGGTTGVAQAYVADSIPAAGRARALGWLSAATSLGVMIGPVIGSLAAHWGREAPGFVAAGLCLANVAFAWRYLPESRRPGEHTAPRKPVWHAAWQVFRRPGTTVARLVWIYAVGMLAFTCLTSVLPLFLGAEYGVTEKTIGYFFLYVGALSLIMRSIFLGPIVDRIGEAWAMRIGGACLVVGLLLYPAVSTLLGLALIIPFVPIGTALLFPSTTALMSRAAEKSELGTVMGSAQTFAGIARVVAPILATRAFQDYGHNWPFYMAAATVALVSVLAFRLGPVAEPNPAGA
ncbi:MAG: MFS transporter [Gemmatimonadales bacterium]|jgi:multidrug resistance protein|nr:MAG: MFS transporter [Gemmatimonadales bacterium]